MCWSVRGQLRLVTGDYLGVTDSAALFMLLDLQQGYPGQVELRVFEAELVSGERFAGMRLSSELPLVLVSITTGQESSGGSLSKLPATSQRCEEPPTVPLLAEPVPS